MAYSPVAANNSFICNFCIKFSVGRIDGDYASALFTIHNIIFAGHYSSRLPSPLPLVRLPVKARRRESRMGETDRANGFRLAKIGSKQTACDVNACGSAGYAEFRRINEINFGE